MSASSWHKTPSRCFKHLWLTAAAVLLLAAQPASAVLRDCWYGQFDPANIGKGGWIYILSNATNKLGGNVPSVTDVDSLFAYMKSQGMSHVIVKAGTSNMLWTGSGNVSTNNTAAAMFSANLVQKAHNAGLLIFGSNRSYGADLDGENNVAKHVFNMGADGFIWDAESEWEPNASRPWITNGPAQAWYMCSGLRSCFPTKFLAHNPYDTLYLHSSFPFKEFGYWSDVVIPQVYHHSASQGSAVAAVHWTDFNYQKFQDSLVGTSSVINGETIYWTNSIKPLFYMREIYNGTSGTTLTPPNDISEFVDYMQADPNCASISGFNSVNWFRSELYNAAHWAVVKSCTIGDVSNVVNNIVKDDASATKVGAWTHVRTIHCNTSTVLFYDESGNNISSYNTNFHSFGTNYWKKASGTGAAYFQFPIEVVTPGDYNLYQWNPTRSDCSVGVPITVNHDGGPTTVYANQQTNSGTWSYVGRFPFAAGTTSITISDATTDGNLALVDGIKLSFVYPTAVPATPTGLTAAAASSSQINLSWNDTATNETAWTVARATISGGPYTTVATLGRNVTSYNDTGLNPGTPYYYVVRASNYLGDSANSSEATATTTGTPNTPVITAQPQSQTTLVGGTASFSVTVTGTAPFGYQWRLQGAPVAGATQSSLTLVNVQPSQAGNYSVVVTNANGSVTSANALLSVNYSLSVAVTGNGSVNRSPSQASYASNSVVTLTANPNPGHSFVNWTGDVTGSDNPITVTMDENKSVTAIFAVGVNDIIIDNLSPSFALTGSWQTGTMATDKYGSDYRFVSTITSGSPVTATYTPNIVTPGYYDVYILYSIGPNRSTAAPWTTVYGEGSVTTPVNQTTSPSQWNLIAAQKYFFSGNSGYVQLNNLTPDGGKVVVADAVRLVYSAVQAAPTITTHPASQTATAGQTVIFTVQASSAGTISYQWSRNGVALTDGGNVSGATTDTLVLTGVTSADADSYTVEVSNVVDSVTSNPATLTVIYPPVISVQPVSVTTNVGATAAFTVSASGTSLNYQWKKGATVLANGGKFSGTTSPTLVVADVSQAEAGAYSVVISNVVGTNTSSTASLTVIDPPAISLNPVSQTVGIGAAVSFTAAASGSPAAIQWKKDGTSIPGATSATYSISSVTEADDGQYSCVFSNLAGVATTTAANLTVLEVPTITVQPVSTTVDLGQTAGFSVQFTGSAATYAWQKLNGETWVEVSAGGPVSAGTPVALTIPNAQPTNAGSYRVTLLNAAANATSMVATLSVTVLPVSITTAPASQTIGVGSNATFTVLATGSGTLAYQWKRDGSDIAGATGSSLTVLSTPANAGDYSVLVTSEFDLTGQTTAAASLTVGYPPSIVTAPSAATKVAGETVTFSVEATGTAPLSYQWKKNGGNLPGKTDASLTLTALTATDTAVYSVSVSNPYGLTTSSANLFVASPPAITLQPASQTTTLGGTVTFSVAASGDPLNYQWKFMQSAIAGATNSSLTINNAQSANLGYYSVVVYNNLASVTSAEVSLSIPSLDVQVAAFSDNFESNNFDSLWTLAGATPMSLSTAQAHGGSTSALSDNNGDGMYHSVPTVAGRSKLTWWCYNGNATKWFCEVRSYAGGSYGSGSLNQQIQFGFNNTANTGTNTAYTATNCQIRIVSGTGYTDPDNGDSAIVTPGFLNANLVRRPANNTWHKYAIEKVPGAGLNGSTRYIFYVDDVVAKRIDGFTGTFAGDWNAIVIGGTRAGSTAANNWIDDLEVATFATQQNEAPVISAQPQNRTVNVTAPATFNVTCTNTAVASYQWRFNGANIPGATNSQYIISSALPAHIGTYDVVVVALGGTVTSTGASLTLIDPVITAQPVSLTRNVGQTATFSVSAVGGSPISYQWANQSGEIAGATDSSFTISSVTVEDAGEYYVTLSNEGSTLGSSGATLTVNKLSQTITFPALTNKFDDEPDFALGATASSGLPVSYQILSGPANFASPGTVHLTGGSGHVLIVASQAGNSTYQPAPSVTNEFDVYGANVAIVSPVAASLYTNVFVGSNITFTVRASGYNLAYQWRKNGTAIAGATGSSYTYIATPELVGTNLATNFLFSIYVSNGASSASADVARVLIKNEDGKAPTIKLVSPVKGTRASSFAISGTSFEDQHVAHVWYWWTNVYNGVKTVSPKYDLVSRGGTLTSPGKGNWVFSLANATPDLPGTNTLTMQVESLAGRLSLIAFAQVFYQVTTPVTVQVAGDLPAAGSTVVVFKSSFTKDLLNPICILQATNPATAIWPGKTMDLYEGQGYTFEVKPFAKGSWYSGIEIATPGNSITNYLTKGSFIARPGTVVTVTINTNKFGQGLAGIYNGLFQVGNTPSQVTMQNAGAITGFKIDKIKGTYSAKLFLNGTSYSFTGAFGTNGYTFRRIGITNKVFMFSNYVADLQIQLPMTNVNTEDLEGTLSNATEGWTANVLLCRTSTNTLAGTNTLVVPPSTLPQIAPGGYGYSTLIYGKLSSATFAGILGDNYKLAAKSVVSVGGKIPVYASLYPLPVTNSITGVITKVGQGMLFGWLDTNANSAVLTWIKGASCWTNTYPAGFILYPEVQHQAYVAPPFLGSVYGDIFNPNPTVLEFADGGLDANGLTFTVAVAGPLVVKLGTVPANSLSAKFTPLKANFAGKFGLGGTATRAFTAITVQANNQAYGLFQGPDQTTGSVLLH